MAPHIAMPGTGDRAFSMTQDDEIVFSLPGRYLMEIQQALQEAGKKVGAQYPVPVYLNFQPEFPKQFKELGKELGISLVHKVRISCEGWCLHCITLLHRYSLKAAGQKNNRSINS